MPSISDDMVRVATSLLVLAAEIRDRKITRRDARNVCRELRNEAALFDQKIERSL